ncbi:MAG TPA: hypothetical protein VNW94_02005 [Streptosporangiaceae bacterium]|jgi:hypothetical protein|nr:hypothetical protein [Streptosporangiaceae bacterium]
MAAESCDHARAATLSEEEDYDLLTYTEAGLRLSEEIALETERIASIEAGGEGGEAAGRARLDALIAAQQRNSRRAVNDQHFERFFGYPPAAKRSGAQ